VRAISKHSEKTFGAYARAGEPHKLTDPMPARMEEKMARELGCELPEGTLPSVVTAELPHIEDYEATPHAWCVLGNSRASAR
jgi:hypothetical protein